VRTITVLEWCIESGVNHASFTPPGFTTAPPSIGLTRGAVLRVVVCGVVRMVCCVVLFASRVRMGDLFLFLQLKELLQSSNELSNLASFI